MRSNHTDVKNIGYHPADTLSDFLKKMLVWCLLISWLCLNNSAFGQDKEDFCSKQNGKQRIGQTVKIWSNGGIYTSINLSEELEWPNKEIKDISGKNAWGEFYPQTGDIGIIIHVLKKNDWPLYLLNIKGYFVPIGCSNITTVSQMDQNEESRHWRIQDSIWSVKYAAGCEFKTRGINNCGNRAGVFPIDTMPEIFICNLKSSGIDTLMLCKYIYDNGSSPMEDAFVLWVDNGNGFLKAYYNSVDHKPRTSKIKPSSEVQSLVQKFFEYDLDSIKSHPKAKDSPSHSMGYSIQLYTPTTFFCGRLTDYFLDSDKQHPKSLWWTLVKKALKE